MKITVLIVLFSLSVQVGIGQPRQKKKFPNIVWITCEDMSANLPSYGDSTIETPAISRLAREGVKYTRMYSPSGVCAPSRSAIITGMYPTSIGSNNMRTITASGNVQSLINYEAVPPGEVKCFSEYFRAAGYYTTNNDKTDYQFNSPVTAWDENSKKAHWRNRPAEDTPFFSIFNIVETHESMQWSRARKPLRVDPSKVPIPVIYPENQVIRKELARYYDNIMVMDSIAGVIIQQLEEDGLLDNTIIVFFSDHGAGIPWFKRELYERGTHVPLIIRYPDLKGAGTINTDLVSFVDLAPSMLSLAGINIPDHFQGKSFLGIQKAEPRQYVYGARDRMDEHYDLVRSVRDKKYRYIRNYQPDKPHYQDIRYRKNMLLMQEILRLRETGQLNPELKRWFMDKEAEELYDVDNDPFELNNLARKPEYNEVVFRMRAELDIWLQETRDKGFIPEHEWLTMIWPERIQPSTSEVEFNVLAETKKESVIELSCPTEGASIAYKEDEESAWRLYTGPVRVKKKSAIIAQAIRIGFRPSAESTFGKRN